MIETMRTTFFAAGHRVDPPTFAATMLERQKQHVRRLLANGEIIPVALVGVLERELGDPAAPTGRPIPAIVNAGRWIAECECGGAEYVEPDEPLFMCCSCWNAADDHRWRPVVLPPQRAAIEAALLIRPKRLNRNWRPGESVAVLEADNAAHGLSPRRDD